MTKLKNNQKGQTILEVMIAVGIMLTGIIGVVSLSVVSNVMSRKSSHEFIATNLAREGVEVVRNIRDSNWLEIEAGILDEDQWDKGLCNDINENDVCDDSGFTDPIAIPYFNKTDASWLIYFTGLLDDPSIFLDGDVYRNLDEGGDLSGLVATPYNRIVSIKSICLNSSDDEDVESAWYCPAGEEKIGINVISWVWWEDSGKQYDKIIEEKLYDWKY